MAEKCWCKTITRLFVTSGWQMTSVMNKDAFKEFTENGWAEERDPKTGFRCLEKEDADISEVRRAAKSNPGMIFLCFTLSAEENETTVHLGIGGAWFKRTGPLSEAIGLRHVMMFKGYVRTMQPRKPRRAKHRGPVRLAGETPHSGKGRKIVQVMNRLTFHGLPDEVERCRTLAVEMLPAAAQACLEYATKGNDGYMSGTLTFKTQKDPAFRIFNRLVARVPAVTVVLEYEDPATGKPLTLRAVDGKIDRGQR